jgi:hypothetical protein
MPGNGSAGPGTRWDDAEIFHGLIDDTKSVCFGARSVDGVGNGSSSRSFQTGTVCYIRNGATIEVRYTGSLVADGINITKVDNTKSNDLFVSVLLIGGDDVQAELMNSLAGTGPVQNIGFQPNCLIAAANFTTGSGLNDPDFEMCMGCVVDNSQGVSEYAMTMYDDSGSDPTETTCLTRNNSFLVDVENNSVSFSLAHTSFLATNGGEHTFTGNTGSEIWCGLYLRFDNDDFGVDEYNGPEAADAGLWGKNLWHFKPQAMMSLTVFEINAWNQGSNTNTGSLTFHMLGHVSELSGDEASISVCTRDSVPTTETKKVAYMTSWGVMDQNTNINHTGTNPFFTETGFITAVGGGFSNGPTIYYALAFGERKNINAKLGVNDVDAVKFGSSEVDKVYLGSTLVE